VRTKSLDITFVLSRFFFFI